MRNLTSKLYLGRQATEKLKDLRELNEIERHTLRHQETEGLESEKIVIDYTNTLITAMNSRSIYNNEIPDPHPCSIDQNSISKENREAF